jgi:hypothetical protein
MVVCPDEVILVTEGLRMRGFEGLFSHVPVAWVDIMEI